MATEDDKVNTGALATVVAVGALGMIGVSLAVNALVRHEVGSLGASRDEVGETAYRTLRQQQQDKLTAPADWSDKAKGHVSIPIERAMGLVLLDLKRSPWNATPAPPPDAGADAAAVEVADAGADAAATDTADAGGAGAPAPESPAPPVSASPPKPKAPVAPTAAAPTARTPTPATPPASPAPTATH